MIMAKQKCATCGKTGCLSNNHNTVWIYNYQVKSKWEKYTFPGLWICEVCKDESWYECDGCLALVEKDNYGAGYLLDYLGGPLICPECYELNSE
jgi:hypothetical protein